MHKQLGLIKETRAGERRVIITPPDAGKFVERGFKVLVETGAGESAGHSDQAYEAVGGQIVSTEEAWSSRYVVKYKAPGPHEHRFFRPDLHLAAYFHAEGSKTLSEAVRRSGMTAYSFELFRTPRGVFPMAVSDNEIAGKLAVIYGAYHLQAQQGGSGVLMAAATGAPPPKVLILGYGNVGGAAARMASSLGASVVVLGTNREGLRRFQGSVPNGVTCMPNTPGALAREICNADLVIGAILISTYDTPPMITADMIRSMRKGSVIVDVTCGYGQGYIPTAERQTSFEQPVFVSEGIVHVKIDALPAAVPVTASMGASALMTPYLIELGEAIFADRPELTAEAGKIISNGAIVHDELLRTFAMKGAA